MKRRDFIKTGLKAGIALNALPLLIGNSPVRALGRSPLRGALETLSTNNGRVLVIVQLAGGNDGLNTLIPVGGSALTQYESLRTAAGLRLTSNLKLADHDTLAWNSVMTGMDQLYKDQKVAVVQNVGYSNPTLSHFRGTDIWNTSTDSNVYASTGWIGRYLSVLNPDFPPPVIVKDDWPLAIQFGGLLSNVFLAQNGGMGIAMGKMPDKSDPSVHNYDVSPAPPRATKYDELEFVRLIQAETEAYTVKIGGRLQTTNKATYPTTQIATDLSSIAQLIKSQKDDTQTGIQTKIYLVTQNGYDTHSNQSTAHPTLIGDLSAALAAFQNDIEQLGIADNVAVMTYSEFGRRPQENGGGTDHGTAAPQFVISSKIRQGVGILGSYDPLSTESPALVAGNLPYEQDHDFRNLYATMLGEWLLAGETQEKIDEILGEVLTTDANGTYSTNKSWKTLGIFDVLPQQDVASNAGAPGLMLMQNYPNPASKITTFEYALPATGPVVLSIYDSRGVEIERVVDSKQEFGVQRASFDVSRLPAGAYLYRLRTSAGEVTQQMVVVH